MRSRSPKEIQPLRHHQHQIHVIPDCCLCHPCVFRDVFVFVLSAAGGFKNVFKILQLELQCFLGSPKQPKSPDVKPFFPSSNFFIL